MVSPRCRAVLSAGAASLLALTLLPGTAYADPEHHDDGFQGEQRTAQQLDVDTRAEVPPIAGALERAAALGAGAVRNDHGTPASLRRPDGGNLSGPRAGTAVEVARGGSPTTPPCSAWTAGSSWLEVLADTPLLDAPDLGRVRAGEAPLNPAVSHVVQLRQTFGGVAAIGGGLVDVGVLPDGSVHHVSSSITPDKEIQVSAALRPAVVNEDPAEGDDPDYDTGGQNRFSELRAFEVLSCTAAAGVACDTDEQFTSRVLRAPDAFPAARPRPTAPDLTLRPFDVPDFDATHVQLEVLEHQCTSGPLYQGATNPDNSLNLGQDPDCDEGASVLPAASGGTGATSLTQNQRVRVAELQVFADPAPAGFDLGPDPVVPEAPATVLPLRTAVAVGGGVLRVRRRRA